MVCHSCFVLICARASGDIGGIDCPSGADVSRRYSSNPGLGKIKTIVNVARLRRLRDCGPVGG